MDYTAVGQTTHLAARMEQLADPGSTLLTAETLALAEGFVAVTSLGPMLVKGMTSPIEVHELTGVSTVRSRLQVAASRGLSRFVGRDTEIEQLHRVVEQARQGRGQVAAIVGEPGVGKSRLVFELTRSPWVQGWLVLEARSVSYGKATSYLPVTGLLRAYFGISDHDRHRDIQEKVTGKILTLDRRLDVVLPALLALLDVPVDDLQWHALDPPQRRQRTLDAVKRLLLREAQAQPLLVVVEDLHWVDTETQALLDSLIETVPAARLVLLVTYRPEYEHRWGSKTSYTQVRLDSLPPESALALLHGLLGEDATTEPLKPILIERTEGNPFFLEESVRAMAETGVLVGERGAYRLVRPLADIQVPATVQTILAARIDRLAPAEKRLLQSAAVIGKDVPFALLAAIADEREEELRRGLASIQAAEFLYEVSLFPDAEYTFKHALTHEVAYGSLLGERRRVLHARIADAMAVVYQDRAAEHLERRASHALRGERWEQAVGLLRQAATKAVARSASREATAYLEQAVGALDRVPETRETIEQAIDIRMEFQSTLPPLAQMHRALAYLREAESLAERLGDSRRLGRVTAHTAHGFWWLGEFDSAVRFGERALAIARSLDDFPLEVLASFRLGQVHVFQGQYDRAIDVFSAMVPRLTDSLADEHFAMSTPPAVTCRAMAGYALAFRGRFDAARAMWTEAIRLAEANRHLYGIAWAHWAVDRGLRIQGDGAAALQSALRCRDIAVREGFVSFADTSTAGLGHGMALAGRPDEGARLIEGAVARLAERGQQVMLPGILADLSEIRLLGGHVAEALARAEETLAVARKQNARGVEAMALRLCGEARLAQESLEAPRAETDFRAALTTAEQLGMRPLVAHCHLGLGKLYRRTDKREQAQEHLATATTMYREMGMTYWLEKAEAAMSEYP
jgi:tetratricopeptide (TPR) repeat protein